jgi:hypothetical protein
VSDLAENVLKAIQSLSIVQLLRVQRYARWRIRWLNGETAGRDHEDLISEAITATLSGEVTWSTEIPFDDHLISVMRDISDGWRIAEERELKAWSLLNQAPRSEDRSASLVTALNRVREKLASDTEASAVLRLMGAGMTRSAIQRRTNLSESQYRAALRRIRQGFLEELDLPEGLPDLDLTDIPI